MQFPDDGNGDMLRALMDAGIDLSQPLAIDFYLVFKNKDQAEKAMAALVASELQDEVELHFNDLEQWELIVSQTMVPEHAAVTAREVELDKFCDEFEALLNRLVIVDLWFVQLESRQTGLRFPYPEDGS